MKKSKKNVTLGLSLALIAGLTACNNNSEVAETQTTNSNSQVTEASNSSESSDAKDNPAEDVQEVKVAFISNYPTSYVDDNEQPTGYDIEVLKLADEALPQYEFAYEYVSYDAAYTGLATGVYDIVLSNAFYTDERAEKYNLPENPLGASLVSLVVRTEDKDIKTLEQAAKAGLRFTPVKAGSGITFVYKEYNDTAETPIELDTSGENTSEVFQWIAEGRYDAFLGEKNQFDANVVDEDGAYHNLSDKLSATIYTSVYTYPVIAKEETELTDALSEQLGILYDNGTLKEISEKFHGYNTFAYQDGKLLDGEEPIE